MPAPWVALPQDVTEEVTKGNVPWSMSNKHPAPLPKSHARQVFRALSNMRPVLPMEWHRFRESSEVTGKALRSHPVVGPSCLEEAFIRATVASIQGWSPRTSATSPKRRPTVDLVGVGRTNAPPSGADFGVKAVHRAVVGQDDVGAFADEQTLPLVGLLLRIPSNRSIPYRAPTGR